MTRRLENLELFEKEYSILDLELLLGLEQISSQLETVTDIVLLIIIKNIEN